MITLLHVMSLGSSFEFILDCALRLQRILLELHRCGLTLAAKMRRWIFVGVFFVLFIFFFRVPRVGVRSNAGDLQSGKDLKIVARPQALGAIASKTVPGPTWINETTVVRSTIESIDATSNVSSY